MGYQPNHSWGRQWRKFCAFFVHRGFVGFFFARLLNQTGIAKLPENSFVLVGMAGVLAGVMFAPLTAIFLIAELSGGYGLMIPLMIVSVSAF